MRAGWLGSRAANTVSLARLVAGLLFATIAFRPLPVAVPAALYAAAMVSDLIDGQIARRKRAESYIGRVLDLISDKSLTIVSLLFAAECGVSIVPLALIGVREIERT
jgi:phosphatidylglycerophosphate synthase